MSESTTMPNDAKVGITLLVIAAATALVWFGKISGEQWVSAVTWISAIAIIGQAVAVVGVGLVAKKEAAK